MMFPSLIGRLLIVFAITDDRVSHCKTDTGFDLTGCDL